MWKAQSIQEEEEKKSQWRKRWCFYCSFWQDAHGGSLVRLCVLAAAAAWYPSSPQSWPQQPLVFVQVLICEKPISPVRGWVGAGREPRLKRVDLWERLVRLPGGAALNWKKPNKPDYPWQSAFVCHGAVLPDGNIQVLSPHRRLRIIAFSGKLVHAARFSFMIEVNTICCSKYAFWPDRRCTDKQ